MKYPKFDLAKALVGEPVVLRDGGKAFIRHYETSFITRFPILGVVVDRAENGQADCTEWRENGHASYKGFTPWDIVGMWVDPVEFKHWDAILPNIKFLAKDENGSWFGYTSEPTLVVGDEGKWDEAAYYPIKGLAGLPDVDWRHSLIKRPER